MFNPFRSPVLHQLSIARESKVESHRKPKRMEILELGLIILVWLIVLACIVYGWLQS